MNWKALAPLLAPFVLEFWNQVVMPELNKLEAQIGSEDLKLVATTITQAINSIAQVEIPKV